MKCTVLFAALVVSGCVAPQSALKIPTTETVTIFVHGYKGSFLQEKDGQKRVAWITPGAAMSEGDTSLAVPFEGQRPLPAFGPVEVTGPLTKITIIPGLFEQEGYNSFMRWGVAELPGFVAFAYDWRADVRESGNELCQFIERLGPNRKVNIVAHSMGGLVTLQCLRHGSDAIRAEVGRVVFLGTPFRGAPGILDDFFTGSQSAKNTHLINVDAIFSFTAAFQLMGGPTVDFVKAADGSALPMTFTAEQWHQNHWGIFHDPTLTNADAHEVKLRSQFEASAALSENLNLSGDIEHLKVLAVIGHKQKTVSGWTLTGATFDLDHPIIGDGDGVVMADRAVPPDALHATIFPVDGEHNEMLLDEKVQAAVKLFLAK